MKIVRSHWAPDHRLARAISILYACIIGFGASAGFHWFSDVVAGAFLGTLVAFNTQRESGRIIARAPHGLQAPTHFD